MANRIKNGTEFTRVSNRGNRAKGTLAVRTLQSLKFVTRKMARKAKSAATIAL